MKEDKPDCRQLSEETNTAQPGAEANSDETPQLTWRDEARELHRQYLEQIKDYAIGVEPKPTMTAAQCRQLYWSRMMRILLKYPEMLFSIFGLSEEAADALEREALTPIPQPVKKRKKRKPSAKKKKKED